MKIERYEAAQESGGYVAKEYVYANRLTEAISILFAENLEGIPLDIVKPEINAARRVGKAMIGTALPEGPSECWLWEFELMICGDCEWQVA